MNTLPPPSSPPTFSRKNALGEESNGENEYLPRTISSNYFSSSSNVSVKRTKRRPLAKPKLKPSRKNSSSYTKTKTSKKKKPNNRTTRRRPLAKPPRKRGGSVRRY